MAGSSDHNSAKPRPMARSPIYLCSTSHKESEYVVKSQKTFPIFSLVIPTNDSFMFSRSNGRQVKWLVGVMVDWCNGWQFKWSVGQTVGRSNGRQIKRSVGVMVGSSNGQQVKRSVGQMVGRSNGRLPITFIYLNDFTQNYSN